MNIKEDQIYAKDNLKFHFEKNELSGLLRIIFEDAFNINQIKLIADANESFDSENFKKLKNIIKRLKNNEPIQYIIGTAEFYGCKFKVNKNVLIPRPETEELVDLIINKTKNNNKTLRIIDVGTGSGCIAVSLAKNIINTDTYALDISNKALETASENAIKNSVKIIFIKADILNYQILSSVPNLLEDSERLKFDIIVSNPPYVKQSEKKILHKRVLDYEPENAIFVSDENHLIFYDAIANFALKNMSATGRLFVEINENHGNEIVELFKNKGFNNIILINDINGKNRFCSSTFQV